MWRTKRMFGSIVILPFLCNTVVSQKYYILGGLYVAYTHTMDTLERDQNTRSKIRTLSKHGTKNSLVISRDGNEMAMRTRSPIPHGEFPY